MYLPIKKIIKYILVTNLMQDDTTIKQSRKTKTRKQKFYHFL